MKAKLPSFALLTIAFFTAAAQAGCEASSSSSDFDGGSTTGSFDGASPTDPPPVGDAGDASHDANADGSLPSSRPTDRSVRFANLSASAHDFCIKKSAVDTFPTLPVFAAQGGIPPMSVSYWYTAPDALALRFVFRVVTAGAPCESAAFYETIPPMQNLVTYRTYWKLDTGSPFAGGFYDTEAATPAKDTVILRRMYASSAVTFLPDDDAGGPVVFPFTGTTLLEPGHPGKLTVDYGSVPDPAPRELAPTAGGLTTIYTAGLTVLVCDELAPPVGHLTDCRATVRAP